MKTGWENKPISEFAKTSAGGTPKKSNKAFYEGGDIPWLLSGEVGQGEITTAKNFITEEGLAGSSAKVFPSDSVLVAMYGATAGNAGILRFPAATNQAVCAVLPNTSYLPEYLYYYLLLAKQELIDQAVGNAQPNISQAKIKATKVPLPPLEEQKRVVAILNEAFAALDHARTHAEANYKNARELFESYLADLFSGTQLGWSACTVGDILTLQRGFDITKKDQRAGAIPVVSSGGIKSFHDEFKASAPGVIVGRKGSIGNVHFVDENYWPHDTTLWVKDFKGNNARLVYYLLKGLRLNELDTGAANPSLNRNLVHPLSVSWPTGLDQSELANYIESIEVNASKAEAVYEEKLVDLEDLRQSLLQKAFAGELT